MGNGGLCMNNKEILNEKANTFQFPAGVGEEQKLMENPSVNDYFTNTNPTVNLFIFNI